MPLRSLCCRLYRVPLSAHVLQHQPLSGSFFQRFGNLIDVSADLLQVLGNSTCRLEKMFFECLGNGGGCFACAVLKARAISLVSTLAACNAPAIASAPLLSCSLSALATATALN